MDKIKTYKWKTKRKKERKTIKKKTEGKEGTCCYLFKLYSGRSVQGDFRQQITQNFVVLLFSFFNCTIDTLHLKARPEKKWDKSINAIYIYIYIYIYICILFLVLNIMYGPLWPQHVTCVDEVIKSVVFDGILLSFLNCASFMRSYRVGSWATCAAIIISARNKNTL